MCGLSARVRVDLECSSGELSSGHVEIKGGIQDIYRGTSSVTSLGLRLTQRA